MHSHRKQKNQVISGLHFQRAILFFSHAHLMLSTMTTAFTIPPPRAMPGQGPESWGAKEPLFFFFLSFSLTTHSIALKMQSWVVKDLFSQDTLSPTMHMVPSYTLGSGASILAEEGETQENKKPIYFYRLKTIYREMTIIQSIITVFFY